MKYHLETSTFKSKGHVCQQLPAVAWLLLYSLNCPKDTVNFFYRLRKMHDIYCVCFSSSTSFHVIMQVWSLKYFKLHEAQMKLRLNCLGFKRVHVQKKKMFKNVFRLSMECHSNCPIANFIWRNKMKSERAVL